MCPLCGEQKRADTLVGREGTRATCVLNTACVALERVKQTECIRKKDPTYKGHTTLRHLAEEERRGHALILLTRDECRQDLPPTKATQLHQPTNRLLLIT